MLKNILQELLSIPSPTFKEQEKVAFIESFLKTNCQPDRLEVIDDNIIYYKLIDNALPTLALVGHSDVVPKHFKPHIKNNHLYGAGASDMQSGLAAFLSVLQQIEDELAYNIVFIVYAREEGTPLTKNGLASVIRLYPDLMRLIDCAIVGEPTDNTIQLGCLGSCHAKITVFGQEAHSARPWNGENALYKALPIIQKLQDYQATKVTVQGLDFQEVMVITECDVSPGRTSIPGHCTFNINYRFGPDKTSEVAFKHIKEVVESCKVTNVTCTLVDSVFAGKIIQSDFQNQLINQINMPIKAKQAWTDVAQLAEAGIPCFNFGPGLQAQAHKDNEYVDLSDCDKYEQLLYKILKKEGD